MRGKLARRWIDRDGTLSDRARTCNPGGGAAVALSQQTWARPVARRHRHRARERDGLCPAGDLLVAEPAAEFGVVGRQPMRGAAPSTIAAGVLGTYRWSVDDRADERWTAAWDYCRYCWMRVVRRPARPCWSMEYCQERNSSTVSVYRLHASSSERRPPRTAATTS